MEVLVPTPRKSNPLHNCQSVRGKRRGVSSEHFFNFQSNLFRLMLQQCFEVQGLRQIGDRPFIQNVLRGCKLAK